MMRHIAFLAALGIMIALGASAAHAQSSDELFALRKALEESIRENVALRAELEAARAEIDRLRGNAARPISMAPMAYQPQAAAKYHEVSEGETLGGIATRYYGNPNAFTKIFDANKGTVADPNKIYPGQKLLIP